MSALSIEQIISRMLFSLRLLISGWSALFVLSLIRLRFFGLFISSNLTLGHRILHLLCFVQQAVSRIDIFERLASAASFCWYSRLSFPNSDRSAIVTAHALPKERDCELTPNFLNPRYQEKYPPLRTFNCFADGCATLVMRQTPPCAPSTRSHALSFTNNNRRLCGNHVLLVV